MEDRNNLTKQNAIYADMCRMASKLLKNNSPSKRVFISCLHQTRKKRTWRFYYHSYFMDKFYSGHYPFVDEGPMRQGTPWFQVVNVEDKTEDYRLTGVLDRKHFQAVRLRITPRKLLYLAIMLVLDPFVVHRLLYYTQDSWMHFYGENPYSLEYNAEFRDRVSYVKLLWVTLERRPLTSLPVESTSARENNQAALSA